MYNGVRERTESSENANGTTTVRTISEVFRNGMLVIKNAEERIIPSNSSGLSSPTTNVPLITQSSTTNNLTTPAVQHLEQSMTNYSSSAVGGTTTMTDKLPPVPRKSWMFGWLGWGRLIIILLIIIGVVWYLKMDGKDHIRRMIEKQRQP
jgi:hypothetical protein